MKILLCCEWYAPSVGGVQKVIKEIAEGLFLRGHDITVATSFLKTRTFTKLNGVKVESFEISGNISQGFHGDIKNYHDFILSQNFDAILIYAAQQWTFDAVWPILSKISAKKIHVPCGYSSLYDKRYGNYYSQMPDILRQFDHLVYNSENYRDIDFARNHSINNYSIIPNGACTREFLQAPDPDFKKKLGINENDFIFLTVGTPPFAKGHIEVAQAYADLQLPFSSTLILDGQYTPLDIPFLQPMKDRIKLYPALFKKFLKDMIKFVLRKDVISAGRFKKALGQIDRQKGKNYLITDLKRSDIISAFFISDLFVFASHIEYSPLVLFESAAAGLAFISVPVGNAEEISKWTQCGVICPAEKSENGNVQVSISSLVEKMTELSIDNSKRHKLAQCGRKRWKEKYSWEKIIDQYEKIISVDIGH